MLSDLMTAGAGLAVLGAGVALIYIGGRDRNDANEHDLSDYHAPVPAAAPVPARAVAWPMLNTQTARPMHLGSRLVVTPLDVLPPAPPGMDAGSPMWRRLVVEQVVPTLSDAAVRGIADEWLRDLGDEARAQLAATR